MASRWTVNKYGYESFLKCKISSCCVIKNSTSVIILIIYKRIVNYLWTYIYQIWYLNIIRVKKENIRKEMHIFKMTEFYIQLVKHMASPAIVPSWLTESSNLIQSSSKIIQCYSKYQFYTWGRRDHMVVRFTSTCAFGVYHH